MEACAEVGNVTNMCGRSIEAYFSRADQAENQRKKPYITVMLKCQLERWMVLICEGDEYNERAEELPMHSVSEKCDVCCSLCRIELYEPRSSIVI